MEDGPPGPLRATTGGRMAAAHAALAKKRALAALQRLAEEKQALQERAKQYGHDLDAPNPTPFPPQEDKMIEDEDEIVPPSIVQEEEKKDNVVSLAKPTADPLPQEKMSSSEDIEIKPISEEEPIQQTPKKTTNPKRKRSVDKKKTSVSRLKPKYLSASSSSSSDEPRQPPTKRPKTVTPPVVILPPFASNNPISAISGAIHTVRNLPIPPVLSSVIRDSAASVGWGFVVLTMVLFKGYVSQRVRSYAIPPQQGDWIGNGQMAAFHPQPLQTAYRPPNQGAYGYGDKGGAPTFPGPYTSSLAR